MEDAVKRREDLRKHGEEPAEPSKLFDDVYYIGRRGVGVLVLDTEEGLVLIDSMDPVDADEKHIVPGLMELGFDPKDINTIIITHGHIDHFAGAARLQAKYGCKVAIGLIDSGFMVTSEYPQRRMPVVEYPRIDIILEDRKPLTYGKHTFIPVLTPGHTPGGMSLMFNVHDQGHEHWASLWVGAGLPRSVQYWDSQLNNEDLQLRLTLEFVHSAYMFQKVCEEQGCDVVLGVHPHRCNLFENIEANKNRQEGQANAFVVGAAGVKENLLQLAHNALQRISNIVDGTL